LAIGSTITGTPASCRADSLPNFHTVTSGIYRGGAPNLVGLYRLRDMGVRVIVDLRGNSGKLRRERAEASQLGLQWVNLPMSGAAPTDSQVSRFLAILKSAQSQPVFVHCQYGADRTGCMIGIWRVTQEGWTFPQAWAEMRQYGFHPRWTKLTQAVRKFADAVEIGK
jgi:protein tyrosine/serine phosphatase